MAAISLAVASGGMCVCQGSSGTPCCDCHARPASSVKSTMPTTMAVRLTSLRAVERKGGARSAGLRVELRATRW